MRKYLYLNMLDKTKFAPALRSSSDQILQENRVVASQKLFREILEAINGKSILIDNNRQIIYANNDFLNLLNKVYDSLLKRADSNSVNYSAQTAFSEAAAALAKKYKL